MAFIPGEFLIASQQFGLDRTDVFLVDGSGRLNVFWVAGAGGWEGPKPIGPAGIAAPGSFIAASQQFGLDQTDVFFIDPNQQLKVAWVVGGGVWNQPRSIPLSPVITLHAVANQGERFIEVAGVRFTPNQPVKLAYDIVTRDVPP